MARNYGGNRMRKKSNYRKWIELMETTDRSRKVLTKKEQSLIVFGEVTKMTVNRISNYLWRAKKIDKIPVWSHKKPRSREKVYCISRYERDFMDSSNDINRIMNLQLYHYMTQDEQAKRLNIKMDTIKLLNKREQKALRKEIRIKQEARA